MISRPTFFLTHWLHIFQKQPVIPMELYLLFLSGFQKLQTTPLFFSFPNLTSTIFLFSSILFHCNYCTKAAYFRPLCIESQLHSSCIFFPTDLSIQSIGSLPHHAFTVLVLHIFSQLFRYGRDALNFQIRTSIEGDSLVISLFIGLSITSLVFLLGGWNQTLVIFVHFGVRYDLY